MQDSVLAVSNAVRWRERTGVLGPKAIVNNIKININECILCPGNSLVFFSGERDPRKKKFYREPKEKSQKSARDFPGMLNSHKLFMKNWNAS